MQMKFAAILACVLALLLAAIIFAFLLPPVRGTTPIREDILELAAATPAPPSVAPPAKTPAATPTPPPSPAQAANLTPTQTPKPDPMQPPKPTPDPTPKAAPETTPTPRPTASPAPMPSEKPVTGKPLSGLVIGVDPGHQNKSNSAQEPVAPGSSETKKKVSSGTQGKYTRVPEHQVVLAVGLHLQKLLKEAGATVVMTRETGDVDISNVERAQLFNKHKVDLGVRLHLNGSTDTSVRGAFMLVPKDKGYPFYEENVKAAKLMLEAYGKATGIGIKKGITYRADQTGFNWCERPIVNIEMGHMTNEEEDYLVTDADFQKRMAQGVFNGILAYFKSA